MGLRVPFFWDVTDYVAGEAFTDVSKDLVAFIFSDSDFKTSGKDYRVTQLHILELNHRFPNRWKCFTSTRLTARVTVHFKTRSHTYKFEVHGINTGEES